jgi:hypothetical protein
MSLALERVCETLELNFDRQLGHTARRVVELAQRGVRDAPTLGAMTLKALSKTSHRALNMVQGHQAFRNSSGSFATFAARSLAPHLC